MVIRCQAEDPGLRASEILGRFMRGEGEPPGQARPFADWPEVLKSTLALMLGSDAQIIFFAGPEFLAFYNDAYAPTIGVKHPQALGNPAAENWSELWQDLEGLLSHVRRTGESISEKDRPFTIDRFGFSETVYFDIAFSAVRSCDGRVEAVLCIVSETTDRIIALREGKESEARTKAVLDSAAAGLCTVTEAGIITSVNDHFAAMLGETIGALSGRPLQSLIDPRDWRDDFLRRDSRSDARGEVRYRRRDGKTLWVSQVLSELNAGPTREAAAFCLLTNDITRRRQEEVELRRMAAIIEGSDDAILAMDLNMTVTSWNLGAERLYGWRAQEIIGTSVLRLLPKGRADEEKRILDRIRAGNRVEPYETTRLCHDGREIPISLSVSPIYDASGEIIGASKIARDISARREAQRMQDYLLFEMKHRVKNILATVVALSRQTLGRLDLPEYETFINRVYALSRSQDLLTRQGQGAASLAALIAEVLEPFPGERFSIGGPELLIPQDMVLSITLALHELVTNALKYGALSDPAGRVSLRWRIAEAGARDNARVRLVWKESGGPPVVSPKRRGFGSVLIRDLLKATLQAEIRLEFAPEGVEFSADFPLSLLKTLPDPPDLNVA